MSNDELIVQAWLVLDRVRFPDYTFEVRESHGGVHLQAYYTEPNVITGVEEEQRTRKWLLSPHMTDSEIVLTAFKCCLTSMEHRTREHFTYRGSRIFGPHFDIEDLVEICDKGRNDAGGRK